MSLLKIQVLSQVNFFKSHLSQKIIYQHYQKYLLYKLTSLILMNQNKINYIYQIHYKTWKKENIFFKMCFDNNYSIFIKTILKFNRLILI